MQIIKISFMITRRHIRSKVMQSIYAFSKQDKPVYDHEEKQLKESLDAYYDLYCLQLSLFCSLKNYASEYFETTRAKHFATKEDLNPKLKFINNDILLRLDDNEELHKHIKKKRLNYWQVDTSYVAHLWEKIRSSTIYHEYLGHDDQSFQEDKLFIIQVFRSIIAPDEKLQDYLEDKNMTWMDDYPWVNTAIIKKLEFIRKKDKGFKIPSLFKNADDAKFGRALLLNTLENYSEFTEDLRGKTPNWDMERITDIDTILIKMALCEFSHFPSIPMKVSINEYVEIAKDYSTPNSGTFINGVLDKLSTSYKQEGKMYKEGRGLL